MSTGVSVNDECISTYQDLKLKKKFKFIVYKIGSNSTQIQVEKTVEDGTYDDFVACLPENDCRYAVYDLEYTSGNEGVRNKICFYTWTPDASKIRQKMIYAASKDALRKKLVGVASEIQCTDMSEIAYSSVMERFVGR